MPSKKDKNKNPYAGWTDPALNDPALDRTLNRFIPPGFGKMKLEPEQSGEPTSATPSEQPQLSVVAEAEDKTKSKEAITITPPLAQKLVGGAPMNAGPPAPISSSESATSSAPSQAIISLDSTHSASEQLIYSYLYRQTISYGLTERHFSTSELMKATGIRSDNTVRKALNGLVEKRSIDLVYLTVGDPRGPRYKVYAPKEIFTRRRAMAISIDPRSKQILTSAATSAATSAVTSAATSSKFAGVTPAKIAEVSGSLLLNTNIILNNKIDDDARARAREIDLLLRSFFPDVAQAQIEKASVEIDHLIAGELRQRAEHASTPPISPQYFVECVRRLCSASQRAEKEPSPSGKRSASRNTRKRKIAALSAQIGNLHVGDGSYTLADLSEDLKNACAREGIEYDAELINEVIEQRQKH